MPNKKDDIYSSPLKSIIDFKFDEKVAAVFPDMIQRSVPGYAMIISNIGIIAAEYAQPDTHCYDLGCSLGAATLSMRHKISCKNCDIIAVDSSSAMIEQGERLLAIDTESAIPVTMICSDIWDVEIVNASVVVLNFTLQFIETKRRNTLIKRIYDGLNKGGVLILSEKIAFNTAGSQHFHEELHHNFKRANGYSNLEISQKRTALENVMIPEKISTHKRRLASAGFSKSEVWFQCFNFISMAAVK